MTKKTDSLIFRFGTQTLWKNTNFLFKTSVSNSLFYNFFQFELKKRQFDVLFLQFQKSNLIFAFIFCFFWQDFKNITYCRQLILIFKLLCFFRFFFYTYLLYKVVLFMYNSILNLFDTNFFLIKSSVYYIFYKGDYFYPLESNDLDSLFLKIEQLYLEINLSNFFKRNFFVKLQNIFNLPIYHDFIQLATNFSQKSSHELTTLEFMLYISSKLRTASIFTRYLAKILSYDKRHKRLLRQTVRAITLFHTNIILFRGIKIYVTGKLNGKMRRKTYSFKCGKSIIHKIFTNLDFFKATSFTKYGSISIKVWLFF